MCNKYHLTTWKYTHFCFNNAVKIDIKQIFASNVQSSFLFFFYALPRLFMPLGGGGVLLFFMCLSLESRP